MTFGPPLSRPPMKVNEDSLFAEPDLALHTLGEKCSWVRVLPVQAIGQRLTPTGSRGFPPESSPPKVTPSIESP